MNYRTLGRTGLSVSEIGFGAWAIGGGWGPQAEQDSLDALHKAIDLGVNFIDTAAGYGNGKSERLIAQVLSSRPEKVLVATKTPPLPGNWPPSPYDLAEERYPAAYLRANVEERLRNLQTDCLDLLQLQMCIRDRDERGIVTAAEQRGEQRGKEVGRRQTQLATARALLANGVEPALIMKYSGLNEAELQQL